MRPGARSLACTLLAALAGCQPGSIDPALESITTAALHAHIELLASDQLEGRAPGTAGARLAAEYIASQFELSGLEPAGGNGSYLQGVPLVGAVPTPALSFRARGGARYRPDYVEDYVAWSGRSDASFSLTGDLRFVGYGISAPEFGWDDYKGSDVEGTVLIILAGDPGQAVPGWLDSDTLTRYGRWNYKLEEAARRGAAGALLIHDPETSGYGWPVVASTRTGEVLSLETASDAKGLGYQGWLAEGAAQQVLSMAGLDYETLIEAARSPAFRPVPTGVTVSASMDQEVRRFEGRNVAGRLTGSDPEMAAEFVVITSHYDHLGKGIPSANDSVYNGAFDNASGTAALLSLADAFARLSRRPRRSLLFLATTAEEAGLLGSRYYVLNPLVPVERTVANVNIDGVNLWGRTQDVIVVGAQLSSLTAHVAAAAEAEGLVLKGDPAPQRGHLYESDQYSFLEAGVPSAYVEHGRDFVGRMPGWGTATRQRYDALHYHRPSDEYDPGMDLGGAVQQARVIFRVIMNVAEAPDRPRWTDLDRLRIAVDTASMGARAE